MTLSSSMVKSQTLSGASSSTPFRLELEVGILKYFFTNLLFFGLGGYDDSTSGDLVGLFFVLGFKEMKGVFEQPSENLVGDDSVHHHFRRPFHNAHIGAQLSHSRWEEELALWLGKKSIEFKLQLCNRYPCGHMMQKIPIT